MIDSPKGLVAVVDDDVVTRSLLHKFLTKMGHKVQSFEDGQAFLDYLEASAEESTPSLVVLDISMPGASGIQILREIRKDLSSMDLPVIIFTGHDNPDLLIEALAQGANDYITKPIHFPELDARISTQLKLSAFYKDSLKVKQFESLNTVVATFCHELNNPLTIALGFVEQSMDSDSTIKLDKARKSLLRIKSTIKEISALVHADEIDVVDYTQDTKIFKIK